MYRWLDFYTTVYYVSIHVFRQRTSEGKVLAMLVMSLSVCTMNFPIQSCPDLVEISPKSVKHYSGEVKKTYIL